MSTLLDVLNLISTLAFIVAALAVWRSLKSQSKGVPKESIRKLIRLWELRVPTHKTQKEKNLARHFIKNLNELLK